MRSRRTFVGLLLSLPLVSRLSLAGESKKLPAFIPGEKLTYSLGWQFIVAGHATLEVLPNKELNGRTVHNFKMKAKTGRAVDPLFKVRDSLSSITELDVSRSLGFKKIQHEGKTKRNVTVDFDWNNQKAHYMESLRGSTRVIDISENTQDPLSAFYFIRTQNFEVGDIIKGPMTDGKRCKEAEIKVVKREKIKVNGIKYDTFKLIPNLKEVGGVFEKSKNAKMEIWCTADHRHIPVLMKSKVMVGNFQAELIPNEKKS